MRPSVCLLALAMSPLACSGSDPQVPECEGPVSLVDVNAFEIVAAGADPYEPPRLDGGTSTTATTARPRCGPSDVRVEQVGEVSTFTVETRYCSRVTVASPTLAPIEAHEALDLRLWHAALIPYGPATAHLAVTIAGDEVFQTDLPIPETSGLIDAAVACERDVPAGAEVAWHVSNHGVNSWNWIDLTAIRKQPCIP